MAVGYLLFLQEQIKGIISMVVTEVIRTTSLRSGIPANPYDVPQEETS